MSQLKVRQNFHSESEDKINKQINMELYSAYIYHSMSIYFDRCDVALPGISDYFEKCYKKRHSGADTLMEYMNKRGGIVNFEDISKPPTGDWGSALDSFNKALELEKTRNKSLLEIYNTAEKNHDAHLTDFIKDEFLDESIEKLKDLADTIAQLQRVSTGLGEYIFDKDLQ